MPAILAQVSLASTSGLTEDRIVNNFAIGTAIGWDPATDKAELIDPISAFYNTNDVSGSSISDYLGASISEAAGAHSVKLYDVTEHLDGSPHGSPVAEGTFTTAEVALNELPREVACCLTLRALGWQTALVEAPDGSDPGVALDRPKQRRSGRVYIGPFGDVAEVGAPSRPTTALLTLLRNSGNLLADQLAANGHFLAVWSRSDEGFFQVTHVETDNAWDTQRSRGVAPSARVTLAV